MADRTATKTRGAVEPEFGEGVIFSVVFLGVGEWVGCCVGRRTNFLHDFLLTVRLIHVTKQKFDYTFADVFCVNLHCFCFEFSFHSPVIPGNLRSTTTTKTKTRRACNKTKPCFDGEDENTVTTCL